MVSKLYEEDRFIVHKKRIAIVTGAAEGIGQASVKELQSIGCHVVQLDIKFDSFTINDDPNKTLYKVDVTKEDHVKQTFKEVFDQFGRIDILINAVGGSLHSKKIEEIEECDWNSNFDLNLKSAFYCTKFAVPYMKQTKWGRIVNISAVAGRTSTFFGGADFASAKAALIGFTRQCGFELASFGITVNAIAPGLTLTDRVRKMWDDYSEEDRNFIMERVPIGRPSTVNEQAKAISFLCSDDASYVCGAVLDINGAMFVG